MGHHGFLRILIVLSFVLGAKAVMPLTPDYYVKAAEKTEVITEICKKGQVDLFEEHVITFVIAQLTQNDEACQIKFQDFYTKQIAFINDKITAYNTAVQSFKQKVPTFIGLWIQWNFLTHVDALYGYLKLESTLIADFKKNSIAGFESYFNEEREINFDSETIANMITYIKLSKTEILNSEYSEYHAVANTVLTAVDSKYFELFKDLIEKFGKAIVELAGNNSVLEISDAKQVADVSKFIFQSMEYFTAEQAYSVLFNIPEGDVPVLPTNLENHFLTNSDNYFGGKILDSDDPDNLVIYDTEDSFRALAEKYYFANGKPFVGFRTLSSIVQFKHNPSKEFVAFIIDKATEEKDVRRIEAFKIAYHLYLHLSMTALNASVKVSKYLPGGHKKVVMEKNGKCDVVRAIFEFILSPDNCLNSNYKGDFDESCPLSMTLGVNHYTKNFPYLYVLLKSSTDCGIQNFIQELVKKTNKPEMTEALLVKSLPVWKMLTPTGFPDVESEDEDDKLYKEVAGWINEGKVMNTWTTLFRKARKMILKMETQAEKSFADTIKKGDVNYYLEKQQVRKKMNELFAESTKFTKDAQNIFLMSVAAPENTREKTLEPLLQFLKGEEDEVIKFFVLEIFLQVLIKIATEYDKIKKAKVANKKAEETGEALQELPQIELSEDLSKPAAMEAMDKITFYFMKMLYNMILDDVSADMIDGLKAYLTKTFVVLGALTPEYYEYVPANSFRRIDIFLYLYGKNTETKYRTELINQVREAKVYDGDVSTAAKWEDSVFNDNFFLYSFTGYESFGELIGVFDLFSDIAFTKRQKEKVESPFLKSYMNTFDDVYSMMASMRLKSAEFGFSPLVHTWKIIHFCSGLRLADSLPIDAELPDELCPLSFSSMEEIIFILLIYMASVDVSFQAQYEIWSKDSKLKFPAVNLNTLFEMAMSDEFFETQLDNFCQFTPTVAERGVPAKAKNRVKRNMDALNKSDLESVWKSRPICLGFDFVVRTVNFLDANPFKEPKIEEEPTAELEEGEVKPTDSKTTARMKALIAAKKLKTYSGVDNENSFDSYEIDIEGILNFLETSNDFNYNTMIWSTIASLYQMDQFNDGFQNLMNRGVLNGFDSIKYTPKSKVNQNNQIQREAILHKKFYKVLCMYDENSQTFKNIALPMTEYTRLRFQNKYNFHLQEIIEQGLESLSAEGITYWAVGGKAIYELVEIGIKYGTGDAATYELLLKNIIEESLWFAVLRFQVDGGGMGEDALFAMLAELTEDPVKKVHDGIIAIMQTKEAEFIDMYQTEGAEPIDEQERNQVEIEIHDAVDGPLDDLFLNERRSSTVNVALEQIESQTKQASEEITKFDGLEIASNKGGAHVTDKTEQFEIGVEVIRDNYNLEMTIKECERLGIDFDRKGAEIILGTNSGTNLSGTNKPATNIGGTNKPATNIGGTNIGGTNKPATNIGGTNKPATNIGGTNIGGTNKPATNLGGTNLGGTNKQGTNLGGTNIGGTNRPGGFTNVLTTNVGQQNEILKLGFMMNLESGDFNGGGNLGMEFLAERKSAMSKDPPDESYDMELGEHNDYSPFGTNLVGGGGGGGGGSQTRNSLTIYECIREEEYELVQGDNGQALHRISSQQVENTFSATERLELESKVVHESLTSFQENNIDHDATIEAEFERQMMEDDGAMQEHIDMVMARAQEMMAYAKRMKSRVVAGDLLDGEKRLEMVGEVDEFFNTMEAGMGHIGTQSQRVYSSLRKESIESGYSKNLLLVCDVI